MDQIAIKKRNRSHHKEERPFEEMIRALEEKITARGDLAHVSVKRQLEILQEFSRFPLGRFILERKGTNGYWTDYLIAPSASRGFRGNKEDEPFSPMEDFFLQQCPVVLAHRERFRIFQSLVQKRLKSHMVLASIPCGVMSDLLTLDFSSVSQVELIGMDIDEESLLLADQLAKERGVTNVKLFQQDAFALELDQKLDLITSSGLNVYESDPQKVVDLYKRFFSALKPGGVLITSVLTYPPGEPREGESRKTDWNLEGISSDALLFERVLHQDILDIQWRNFRSSWELDREFKQVGFSKVSVYFDWHCIFPTILAQKPS